MANPDALTAVDLDTLRTRAERTDYRETSLHADVMAFLRRAHRLAPSLMRLGSIGRSAEGRAIPFVVLSGCDGFTPRAARALRLPIVMVSANIHAGEVEGKEALLAFIRELLFGPLRSLLNELTLVFVPIFNPDGNDRISTENRRLDLVALEGQIGPEGGVGTRNTGEGWNLNRDYMKQEAIESNHLARLYGAWWPHVFVDCHTTDGSVHAYDLTFDTAHTPASGHPDPIEYARRQILPSVADAVFQKHGRRGYFYGNYRDQDDPTRGWETYPGLPRFGSHYRGLTGRIDILLETYSYIDFRARVQTISAFLLEIFRYVADHSGEVISVVEKAERETIARGGRPQPDDLVGINYGVARRTEDGRLTFDWPVHYLEPCSITAYDRRSIVERKIPGRRVATYETGHYARFIPTVAVPRPWAYVVTGHALTPTLSQRERGQTPTLSLWERGRTPSIAAKLRQHNLRFQEIARPIDLETEAYVIADTEKTASPDICTGIERFETVLTVRKERRAIRIDAGALLVPTAQPLGNLVVYLLEPESDDGLARWEFFDDAITIGEPFPVFRIAQPTRIPVGPWRGEI